MEVDDISQLEELATTPLTDDAGQEREYTFEEADEATLAELGLLDGGTPAETAAADQATETKPAPRRRSRKPAAATGGAADAGAADAGAGDATTARPKGRSRKASATAGPEAPADEVRGKAGAADPRAQVDRHRAQVEGHQGFDWCCGSG